MSKVLHFILGFLLVAPLFLKGQQQDKVYDYVNQPAKFPGGDFALYEYLHKHIDFEQKELNTKLEGPVQVNFIVEQDGSISHIELRLALNRKLDNQVLDAVRNMPPWIPAKILGKPVRSRNQVRVEFVNDDLDTAAEMARLQSFRYPIERAMYAMEKQYYREAIAYFSVFLSEYPKDSFALFYRAGALYNVNRHREACIDWKDAQTDESQELFDAFCVGMRGVKYHSSVDTNYQKFLDTLAVLEGCVLEYDSSAHYGKDPDALRKYYKKHMNPDLIREYRIPRVVLSFNVDADGKVENVWVVRSYSATYDREAIRLVENMKDWQPATKDGKKVKSKLLFQIIFNDKSTKTGKFIHDFFDRE